MRVDKKSQTFLVFGLEFQSKVVERSAPSMKMFTSKIPSIVRRDTSKLEVTWQKLKVQVMFE